MVALNKQANFEFYGETHCNQSAALPTTINEVTLMSINFGNNDSGANNSVTIGTGLKDNSKVLMGAAVIVGLGALAYLFMSANSSSEVKNLMISQGQEVTIDNPNGGLSHITSGPGMMSASVSEEDKEQSICTAQPGTRGVVEDQQVIDMLQYVKVRINDGDCEGKSGWTTKTNIRING